MFTGTWHYENGTIVDRLTIRPYNDTAESFCAKQVMPWGKGRIYDLPAMIAAGTEIILEDIVFADEAASATTAVRKIPLTKAEFMNRPMSFEYEPEAPVTSCASPTRTMASSDMPSMGGYFFKSTVTGKRAIARPPVTR